MRTKYVKLRLPQFFHILQRVRRVNGEANHDDISVWVGQWPESVIGLLTSRVPDGEFHRCQIFILIEVGEGGGIGLKDGGAVVFLKAVMLPFPTVKVVSPEGDLQACLSTVSIANQHNLLPYALLTWMNRPVSCWPTKTSLKAIHLHLNLTSPAQICEWRQC